MSTHTLPPTPDFDLDGFLCDMERWNEDLARHIAALDGLGGLDDDQLAVVRQLREAFRRTQATPALAHVCHLSGFDPDCMTQLFPSAREAWRIAGLPNPGEEAKAYM